MSDVLVDLFDDLRAQRPHIADYSRYAMWEDQIGAAIAALPTRQQRWASTLLVANDLVRDIPGLVLSVAYLRIAECVLRAGKI